jgi:hypothetical protein
MQQQEMVLTSLDQNQKRTYIQLIIIKKMITEHATKT